ncbi:glycosyl hydrolase [Termitidicoccus mucosus]|uniref:glycosyl hydrolase n=1 Tax=Termitidicoccus mucosus TaxID=1184151 RepID=UPI00268D12E0
MTYLSGLKYKLSILCALVLAVVHCHGKDGPVEGGIDPADFRSPKKASGPYVWWHWVGYNVDKEGITKDLESMRDAGVAGATLFQLVSTATDRYPPVANTYSRGIDYFNEKWWELVRHSAAEAKRLGLELGMHNCIGWSVSGGPWIQPENAMQHVVWSETKISGPRRFTGYLSQPAAKLNYYNDIAVLLVPDGEPAPKDMIDISGKMQADGKIICEIPKGSYTIYRFGHTPTGAKPTSAPENIDALEADKMSAEAMTFHMRNILAPLKAHVGQYLGSTLNYMLFDSYEAGDQNWTARMRPEFLARKGYDIIPWLPVLAGRIVESQEATEGFKWDLKTAVSDMFVEYSYQLPKKMLRELGMQIQIEPYATGPVNVPRPFNTFDAARVADLPTTEFWTRMRKSDIDKWHVNAAIPFFGINLLSAEAFTGGGTQSRWTETPAQLKFSGDVAFSKGVNRMILHHWVHQPFPDHIKPGMSMGPWGTHFGRNQTWFEPGKAWIAYLSRSQYLLQKGERVSDFVSLDAYIPGGDIISEKTLINHTETRNGKIVSPFGRTYSLLAVPHEGGLSLDALIKLEKLVTQGAIVFGPRPARAKGYRDLAANEEKFKKLTDLIWGKDISTGIQENIHGKGRVLWGGGIEDALRKLNIASSVIFHGGGDDSICWLHRRAGDADIFYFANTEATARHIRVALRAQNKTPETWDPETGDIAPLAVWSPTGNGADVSLHLKPNQALFVVFRNPIAQDDFVTAVTARSPDDTFAIETNTAGNWIVKSGRPGEFALQTTKGKKLHAAIDTVPVDIVIGGAWQVEFKPPVGSPFPAKFEKLESWTLSNDERIRYFAGTATYSNRFRAPDAIAGGDLSVSLDLGVVKELASVSINGKPVATLWHAPFEVDITEFIKPGENEIAVSVTNTWANRLIGDNNHPDDCEWGPPVDAEGRALRVFPEWLIAGNPRPSKQRAAFSSWNYFNEKSALLDAGLLSEVKLQFRKKAAFQSQF